MHPFLCADVGVRWIVVVCFLNNQPGPGHPLQECRTAAAGCNNSSQSCSMAKQQSISTKPCLLPTHPLTYPIQAIGMALACMLFAGSKLHRH